MKTKIFLIFFSLIITLALANFLTSFFIFKNKDLYKQMPANETGIYPPYQLANLLKKTLQYSQHPWRGYKINETENYYAYINKLGYRIDNEEKNNDILVGFFGGSTAFSVFTTNELSIPKLIETKCNNNLSVLNFGVGGYSSLNEIGATIEAIRHYNLDHLIFYDGVNEVGRYIEYYQWYGDNDNIYSHIGFPYDPEGNKVLDYRKSWEENLIWLKNISLGRLFYKAISKLQGEKNSLINFDENKILDKIDYHTNKIFKIYINNISVISSILNDSNKTFEFLWQPNLAFKAKNKNEINMNILEKTIHKNLIKHINKDKNIKNISNIFEKDNRYIFVDSNHGGKTLNDAVSNEIIKESNFLSKHCNNKI